MLTSAALQLAKPMMPPLSRATRAPERAAECTLVGESDAFKAMWRRVELVAPTDATVLLLGETGTGKGMIAREIHARSPRRRARFVEVNCAALPAPLIESELFGRERGAFTDAITTQPGRFELAQGGTIFLDEIGELPLDLQAKLLRVLQEGEVERLGSPRTIQVDVRVIAATNRNIHDDVKAGRFRQDLFYRLNVFPISSPPLRVRHGDVPLLASHFVSELATRYGKRIDAIPLAVIQELQAYDWPGNVRELEHVLERAMITATEGVLQLVEPLNGSGSAAPPLAPATRLTDVERLHIERILSTTSWRIEGPEGAASALGLRPSTLRSRMAKLGIKRPVRIPAVHSA